MGEVWAGVHVGIGVRVALKRLLPAGSSSHETVARFKREAYLLGRVRSDYVARVLDFVDDKVFGLVLVMELVEGSTLYDVLNERRFSIEEGVDLGTDIVNGLCDLHHSQIVHRDLKPGNIIVEQRARGRQRAMLVDFGMSRVMTQAGNDDEEMTGITRADVALGTLEYMAPEQMLNSRGVTGSADIYATGIILWRAVAGRHAYQSDSEGGLVRLKLTEEAPPLSTGRADAIARGFEAIVAKAMRRKPNERYLSAEAMLKDLEALQAQVRNPHFDDSETLHHGRPPGVVPPVAYGRPAEPALAPEPASSTPAMMPEHSAAPFSLKQGSGSVRGGDSSMLVDGASASGKQRSKALPWVLGAVAVGLGGGLLATRLLGSPSVGGAASASAAPSVVLPATRPEPTASASVEPAASAASAASVEPAASAASAASAVPSEEPAAPVIDIAALPRGTLPATVGLRPAAVAHLPLGVSSAGGPMPLGIPSGPVRIPGPMPVSASKASAPPASPAATPPPPPSDPLNSLE